MGRTREAFRRNWCIWVVLFFAGGIKALVNSVEQPFARSLIHCDVPLEAGTYTGSRWCGDRIHVIQSGLELSALGQSQENISMLLLLPFVVVSTGIWGPKLAMIVGLVGVVGSVVLFFIACSSLAWGRTLFAVGQFLQGAFPIEYLTSILFMLMSFQPDNDPEANMQLMTYLGFLAGAIWNSGLGDVAQLLEVADYRGVWVLLMVLNAGILLLTVFGMPSERPPSPKGGEAQNPVARLFHEMLSYKTLFTDWVARRLLVKSLFEALIPPFHGKVAGAEMMAYHGWSQRDLTFLLMLPQLLSVKCLTSYGQWFGQFGELFAYSWTLRLTMFNYVLSALTLPFTHRWHLGMAYVMALFSGFQHRKYGVEQRYVDQEQMVRFQNVQWLLNYFLGIWVGPMYVAVFDASAQTYSARVVPGLLCCCATALLYISQFYGLYDLDGVRGWGNVLGLLDKGGRKAIELWKAIVFGPGPGIGYIGQEKFREYKLEEILGLKLDSIGGGVHTLERWLLVIGTLNNTNAEGMETLQKLDRALEHANSLWPKDERHRRSLRLWQHLGHRGEVSEDIWAVYKVEELLGRCWKDAGGPIRTWEQFDALVDVLLEDAVLDRLQKSLTHAEGLYAKHLHAEKKAKEASQKAPGRQLFLARGGQLGMLLMLSEVVLVGHDPGSNIFHALLGLTLWLVARKPTRVGAFRAFIACWLSLWLGGAGVHTGWGSRRHIVNLLWLIHIFIFSAFGVLRYFFELDMDERKPKQE